MMMTAAEQPQSCYYEERFSRLEQDVAELKARLNSKRENRSLQHILSQNEFYNAAKKQREFNYIIRAYNDKRSKEEDKELLNYRLKKESAKIIKEFFLQKVQII